MRNNKIQVSLIKKLVKMILNIGDSIYIYIYIYIGTVNSPA